MNNSYSNTLFYTILSHNFLAIHLHVLQQFFIIATMHKTAISFFYFLLLWYQVKGLETLLPPIIHSWDIFTSPLKSWIWEILLYTSAYIYIYCCPIYIKIFSHAWFHRLFYLVLIFFLFGWTHLVHCPSCLGGIWRSVTDAGQMLVSPRCLHTSGQLSKTLAPGSEQEGEGVGWLSRTLAPGPAWEGEGEGQPAPPQASCTLQKTSIKIHHIYTQKLPWWSLKTLFVYLFNVMKNKVCKI